MQRTLALATTALLALACAPEDTAPAEELQPLPEDRPTESLLELTTEADGDGASALFALFLGTTDASVPTTVEITLAGPDEEPLTLTTSIDDMERDGLGEVGFTAEVDMSVCDGWTAARLVDGGCQIGVSGMVTSADPADLTLTAIALGDEGVEVWARLSDPSAD